MNIDVDSICEILEDTGAHIEFYHGGVVFRRDFEVERGKQYHCKLTVPRWQLDELDIPFIELIEDWLYESQYQFDKYKEGLK